MENSPATLTLPRTLKRRKPLFFSCKNTGNDDFALLVNRLRRRHLHFSAHILAQCFFPSYRPWLLMGKVCPPGQGERSEGADVAGFLEGKERP